MRTTQLILTLCLVFLAFTGCQKEDEIIPNKVPVAEAGPAQSVQASANPVQLSGSGTDEDGQIVAYLWSQVTGPTFTTIQNPGSPATPVRGFGVGTYRFQLMVTDDDGLTGVDTVTVNITAPPAQVLTLQPANNPTEVLYTITGTTDNTANHIEHALMAWTVGGIPAYGRAAIKFDLSSIPANAIIDSAYFYLYSSNPPLNGNMVDANFGTNNSLYIQRITSPWTAASAAWNSQPSVSTADQISIPHTSQSFLDLKVDVKNMVSTMVSGTNNGFMVRLQSETIYTSRTLVSSYYTTRPTKHPKIVVGYHF